MIEIQTQDAKMKEILNLVQTTAPTKSYVLIQGEVGTGKAMLSKFIHEKSGRSTYIIVNCAQQPETLLETELFGFEKSAFAGTVSEKRGKLEQANGGTLVLDDIAELPSKLQVKLLKVIETGCVERIGAKTGVPIEVRLICMSNKNLAEHVNTGKFLEPLYSQLSQTKITMPALRDRVADLKWLISSIMGKVCTRTGRKVSGITEEAVEKLSTYSFPGNLRELEGILERAMMVARDGVIYEGDITVDSGPTNPHQGTGAHTMDFEAEAQWAPGRTLEEIERAVILKSLAFHNGNRTHTARELGISIRTLRNKLNLYRKAGINI